MSTKEIRLTKEVSCAGCAAKLVPSYLRDALSMVDWYRDENVLCAADNNEDAGVYKLDSENALIQTTDFFTPVVDDPYTFGQIAATNALSDVYAMGGTPLSALNIVCFKEDLDYQILGEILKGGANKAKEAHCSILGGHSVKDSEIKYGLAVTGKAKIKEIKYNSNAKLGDLLILTKPLGTGVLNTALKRGEILKSSYQFLIDSMTNLNDLAAKLMVKYAVSSATDITGFSLVGHAMEMARASKVSFNLNFNEIPLMPELIQKIKEGYVTRGDKSNRQYTEGFYNLNKLTKEEQSVVFDPQTSGGLLISVSKTKASELLKELKAKYPYANIIGEVVDLKNTFGQINFF